MKIRNFPKQEILIFLPILLIASILLGKALFPGKNGIIYGGDLLSQFYYWKGFLRDSLFAGFVPFWNPYNFSGMPFLAHPAVAAFYPFTLLFLILPINIAFSINYYIHLVIGGAGVFFLSKRYGGALSSFISSSVFMLGGFISARIYAGHFDLLTTSVWIPWVIFAFLRISDNPKSKRNFLLGIISLSLLILAGYSAYLVFILEFILFLTVYLFIKRKPDLSKIVGSYLLVIIFSLGITGVQWLPTWQLTKNSIRSQGLPYDLASWGSLPISGLKLFFNPLDRGELNKISFNLGGGPKENPFDHFVGRTPLLIIFIFIIFYFLSNKKIKARVNSDFWFYLVVCLFFLFVSFGGYLKPSLHYFLYQLIPFYRYIRIPIQNLIIPVVLIPVITGMILSKIKSQILQIIIGIVIIAELLVFGRNYIFLTALPGQNHDKSIINNIVKTPGDGRILPAFRVISPILDRFDFNAGMMYGFESTSGYDPVILKNYYDFIDMANGGKFSSLVYYNVEIPPIDLNKNTADLLNVSAILNEDGSVVERKSYLPRFYFAEDNKCQDKNTNIRIIEYSINKIILKISNMCDSKLMSSEVDYPGWKASVDGKNTPIIKSNIAFRTIYLPKGEHQVEYYFYPYIYILGLITSIFSLITFYLIIKYSKFLIHDS